MKKYRLLKELLGHDVGTIFTPWDDPSEIYSPKGKEFPRLSFNEIKDPEWFEEVIEWPKNWEDLKFRSNGFDVRELTDNLAINHHHSSYKSITARLKLEELAEEMNGDWKPDWNNGILKHIIVAENDSLSRAITCNIKRSLVFKTKKMAEFSLKHHRQLWLDYWQINE